MTDKDVNDGGGVSFIGVALPLLLAYYAYERWGDKVLWEKKSKIEILYNDWALTRLVFYCTIALVYVIGWDSASLTSLDWAIIITIWTALSVGFIWDCTKLDLFIIKVDLKP